MSSKTFLVVNAIPNRDDLPSFQSYLTQIIDVFKKYGGTGMQRFKTVEALQGDGGIQAIAFFEFPDSAAIKMMYASKEFNELNDLRKKAYAKEVDLMICTSA